MIENFDYMESMNNLEVKSIARGDGRPSRQPNSMQNTFKKDRQSVPVTRSIHIEDN